jgi:gliding motility-associated protein GldL
MGIKQIVESKGYKNFMSKLYGWGASAVIIGALFKIQHYPGAGLMLLIGMGTEALIFFASAFEPLHVEPDWSLVYPELWGIYHPEEAEKMGWEPKAAAGGSISGGKTVTQELDKMLEDAKIGPELIASLGEGMKNLSVNANKLSGVADAAAATDGFVTNLGAAANSVSGLKEVYDKTASSLNKTVGINDEFVETVKAAANNANETASSFKAVANAINNDVNATEEYVTSIKGATNAAHALAQKYTQSAESLTKSAEAIDFSAVDGKSYGDQIQRITKNLSALNAVYELQLQGANAQVEKANAMQESLGVFVENVNMTMSALNQYKDQATVLSKNLAALNTVYGNMLTAMNVNLNK